MVADLIEIVPPWMLLGATLGGLASVAVAAIFYVGHRLSPPSERGDRSHTDASDARRRREIREYLTMIGERFSEDRTVGDVTVPFYLPERDVAITFDAHDYFRLEGAGVFTILCEHEMPGRGLGRRLPFDVNEPDWEANRRGAQIGSHHDPVDDAFAELGLPTDAGVDDVKRAYRERVKEVHPDQGGDEESFRRVREAYATASNHANENGERIDPVSGFSR